MTWIVTQKLKISYYECSISSAYNCRTIIATIIAEYKCGVQHKLRYYDISLTLCIVLKNFYAFQAEQVT